MSSVKTEAIVLRHAAYGEGNRMLTLLTPAMGLVSVSVRGCRKVNSKMLSATELFTVGEYVLHERAGRYTVTSFQLSENYYPIRMDVDRLAHGVYWLNLCEAAAQPDEESGRLFKMLLLSLAVLAYGDLPPRALTAVFLIQFSLLQGFSPNLDACTRCGKPLSASLRYSAMLGGACCSACAGSDGQPLSQAAYAWLCEAQQKGAFVLAGRRALPAGDAQVWEEALAHMRAHVESRMEKRLLSAEML